MGLTKPKLSLPSLGPLGLHHGLMVLLLAACILLSVLLSGCSSSTAPTPDIYLLAIRYSPYTAVPDPSQGDYHVSNMLSGIVGGAQLQVRAGYFGMCANTGGGSWLCSNNATSLAAHVAPGSDPLNLLWTADHFKRSMMLPWMLVAALALAFVSMVLLHMFPAWHDCDGCETKRFPSRPLGQVALTLAILTSVLIFTAVIWQYTAAASASITAQSLGNGSVVAEAGVAALALGWTCLGLVIVVIVGLLSVVLSQRILKAVSPGQV